MDVGFQLGGDGNDSHVHGFQLSLVFLDIFVIEVIGLMLIELSFSLCHCTSTTNTDEPYGMNFTAKL